MKTAVIYVTDAAAVEALLESTNPRVQRRVTLADVQRAVQAAESKLGRVMGIAKKDWKDVVLTVSPERNRQPSVGAYTYRASAIEVVLRYRVRGGWYIAGAYKTDARNDNRANSRDWFLAVPENLVSLEKILERLGVDRVDAAA